jgi:hypothetical protein
MQPTPTDLTFFTAGYQGHNIETFLDLLMSHGVEQLIDVRQLPFSRKPDFSQQEAADGAPGRRGDRLHASCRAWHAQAATRRAAT